MNRGLGISRATASLALGTLLFAAYAFRGRVVIRDFLSANDSDMFAIESFIDGTPPNKVAIALTQEQRLRILSKITFPVVPRLRFVFGRANCMSTGTTTIQWLGIQGIHFLRFDGCFNVDYAGYGWASGIATSEPFDANFIRAHPRPAIVTTHAE